MSDNKPATIQGAVEKSRGDAPKQSLATVVREAIEKQTVALAAVLPEGANAERYSRLVITAVKATPKLMECFGSQQGQTSVMLAVMQLAAVDLEPNTLTQDAWLLPRKNKGVMECQASISYRGLAKLMRRSGIVKGLRFDTVRQGDRFDYGFGLADDTFEHIPLEDNDGPLTHAYAIVRYTNGGYDLVVLTRKQVEKRRASSDSWRSEGARPYSPWTKFPEEMWRKSAMRALLTRTGLLEAEVQGAVAYDERTLVVGAEQQILPAEHRADDDLDAIEAGTVDPD